ncbi:MAG TPA: iron-sulfur cluster assembly scaffold protein [Rhizomicrobium sp.]|nr:iron-sulfur cluster assembly scaffold protein [Rhizomicrobium sp.]
MSDPLYQKDLLRLAADAHGAGRLTSPHVSGFAFNPACGDKVVVDLRISDGRIVALAHETKACVLAQASSSILGASLKGVDRTAFADLYARVAAMLETGAAPPCPPFDSYAVLSGAAEYRSRHRCVLLPLDAVVDALAKAG